MPARFDLYYETSTLREQIEPMLSSIPDYFYLRPCDGTCELKYHSNVNWQDFPFPVEKNTVYIFWGDGKNRKYAGGNSDGCVSVMVQKQEISSPKKISLRIWHELLHAVGQPADGMKKNAAQWITSPWMLWIFNGLAVVGLENRSFFHEPYYQWLTERAHNADQ